MSIRRNFVFNLDGFSMCRINKEHTGLSVDVLLATADSVDEKFKPYLWTEGDIGYNLVYIRNDYKYSGGIEAWIVENYNVLIRHWNHEITDKETINILSKTKEK